MSLPDVPAPAGSSFPVVDPSASTTSTTPAAARRWPVVLLVVLGAVGLIVMVPLFRHGVVTHAFPSYVRDDPSYEVQRWSAPWIGGALAAGGLGLVCWATAAGLLARARRRPVAPRLESAPSSGTDPVGLAPRRTEAAREY